MKKILLVAICCLASWVLLAGGAGGAWGADYCVYPGGTGLDDLQNALSDAAGNSTDDTIKVVMGTYTGNFVYSSTSGYDITLEGGYATGCTGRVASPILTALDGNSAGTVLTFYDNSGGSFMVDAFTIRNGSGSTSGGGVDASSYSSSSAAAGDITLINNIITGNNTSSGGGGVFAYSYSLSSGAGGTVLLRHNIIQGNSADYGGGVDALSRSTSGMAGDVTLINNIITGNTASSGTDGGGGVFALSQSTSSTAGTVTLTNNTITGNTAHDGGGANIFVDVGGTINCYNNIIWGNTGTGSPTGVDIYLDCAGTAYGYCNDYHDLSGTWNGGYSDNIDQDPLFAGAVNGDYHLLPTSPCIDTGVNSAPNIPGTDSEGDNRIIDGDFDATATADMGADEFAAVYVILHKDGALWSSATGWLTATSHYYPGTAYAQAFKLWGNSTYLILHKEGAYFLGLAGIGLWTMTTPPYYPGTSWAVDILGGVILHQDGCLWYAATGWVMTSPPYYSGTAYAKDLEVRTDSSYVILHKDGAVYDSASGWVMTSPPYYAGSAWAVDMKLEESGYVILHKDGALWSTSGGWVLTSPPFYAGSNYARALELVVNGYVVLHKDGAIYNSVSGWTLTIPPYYSGSDYAVDLEMR